MTSTATDPSPSTNNRPANGSPSLRSQLLADLQRRHDRGEDIASRTLSGQLARQYGCSRALVVGARRTILDSQHSHAFDELCLHFGGGALRQAG